MGIEEKNYSFAGGEKDYRPPHSESNEPIPSSRLQEILDTSPVGVGIVREFDGKILFTNKRIAEIRGEAVEASRPETYEDSSVNYWADPEEFNRCLAIYKEKNHLPSIEVELKRLDGTTYPALTSWETIYHEKQKCILYWVYDLTAQKHTENEFRKSESQIRNIMENSPIGVGIARIDTGEIVFSNKRLAENNRSDGSVTGRLARDGWVHPEERDEFLNVLEKEGRVSPREVLLHRQDGTEYTGLVSWEGIEFDGEHSILFWSYDISALKETEEALRAAQAELAHKEQLATLGQLEVINEIAEELHRSTDIMTVAKRATEVIQRYAGSPTAAISMLNEEKQTLDLLHSTDGKKPEERVGIDLPVSMSVSGEAVNTQRVTLCPNLPLDPRIHPTVKAVLVQDGYRSSVTIPLIYQEKTLGVMNLLFRDWHTLSNREQETLGALGKTIGLAISNAIHVTRINEEVHERTTLEAQLLQAQKIESIGQLAGGIAHDFNNLLVVISGYSDLILSDETLSESTKSFATEIVSAGERAAKLTNQLLTFGRRQTMNRSSVDVDSLLKSLQGMFSRLIPENIEQVFHIEPNLPLIFADRSQIEQVMVNLAVNARDAMPDGGRLTFSAKTLVVDEPFVRYHPALKVGTHVLIKVIDSGIGMGSDILQKIFEPFFTTKSAGEGTGLGLPVVFGIVAGHDGHIDVRSNVGAGTEFLIYLPTTDVSTQATPESNSSVKQDHTETVLLVEDDVQVREFAQKVLQLNGFSVLTAENGNLGIEEYEAHRDQVDLIISDVVMPKMGGPEMIEHLWDKGYNVPVLFTSGYSPDSSHRYFLQSNSIVQLDKPFTPDMLIKKIEELLT